MIKVEIEPLNLSKKKLENSARFTEDPIKIGAFYKLYYKEILLIIGVPEK